MPQKGVGHFFNFFCLPELCLPLLSNLYGGLLQDVLSSFPTRRNDWELSHVWLLQQWSTKTEKLVK